MKTVNRLGDLNMKTRVIGLLLAGAFLSLAPLTANAVIFNYTDLATYLASAGAQTTISFDEVPAGTTLGAQYAGVNFNEGDDRTLASASFLVDGFGAEGINNFFDISFSASKYSVGFDYPGAIRIDLYQGVTFLGSSDDFGGVGGGFFGGVISDVAFDRVVVTDWYVADVFVDEMHYGDTAPVPEPSSLVLLGTGLAGLAGFRLRRGAKK